MAECRPSSAGNISNSSNSSMGTSPPQPISSEGSAIQVVVRLRPINDAEKKHGTLPVITGKTQERSVTVIKGKGRKQLKSCYTFDNVFTAFSTQEEVFEATVKPVIMEVMRGFESTVFAYGQTGTGKTHTMEGSLASPDLYGVIPRSAQAIFEHLKLPQYKEQVVTCSYLEIYNEELRDLLAEQTNGGKLEILEGKDGTFCRGLTERQVRSAADVLNLMQKAQHSRMIGETKMNKASSRSHCLFTIQVHGKISLLDGDGDMEFIGKLHLVDLAGSECAKSAGNDKSCPDAVARERERMNINRSLLTLGRVITILKEKSLNKNANARIPYRDSKLTRVLQEALGGRCKTVVIATISPSITAIEESISTLNYAHSANGIVNNPVSSSLIAFGDGMPGMGNSSDSKAPPTVESWQEMEMRLQYMQTQVDEAQAALARKHLQTQEFQEREEKVTAQFLESQQQLYAANKEIKTLKGVIDIETEKRKVTEKELQETQIQLKRTEFILKATQDTESTLTSEAKSLISTLENIVIERNDLHALVVLQRDQEIDRRRAAKQFHEAALVVLSNIALSFNNISTALAEGQIKATTIATQNHETGRHSISETQQTILDIAKNVSCVTDSLKSQLVGDDGVVPIVETSSKSILNCVRTANDAFLKGEDISNDSCESMRRRLDECTKDLDERSSAIQTSTSQALQSFEEKVTETRNALTHLVMKMKNSLSNLTQAKVEKSKTLDYLLGQWRDQSLTNSKSVFDQTKSNLASLTNFIDSFQNDMVNHSDIEKTLEKQRSFIGNECSAHAETIDLQGSMLRVHRQAVAESHETQTKLRNEIMQSILSGVQAIVSSEIEKLATTQTNHFQVLEKGSADLASTNQQISQSAKVVLENLQTTNQILSDKASAVLGNDLKAAESMKATQNTLKEVMKTTKTHHELATTFASKSLTTMSELDQLEAASSEVVKAVERDEKVCSSSLINGVLKPMSAAMNDTMHSSLDAIANVNETFAPNVTADIDGMAENRKIITSQMRETFDDVCSQVSEMAGAISNIATTQSSAVERLGNAILFQSNKYSNEVVPRFFAELDTGKEQLVSTVDNLANVSNHSISEGRAQGSVVKKSVNHFSHDQLHCNMPIDPIPQKKEFVFNHELSSTPDEAILLKGVDFEDSKPEDSATGLPDDSSQGSYDDDTGNRKSTASLTSSSLPSPLSRKSAASITSSLPSPRLKYRDTNANQWDNLNSGSKLSKHKRPAVNASTFGRKNNCPSGLPSPSKRIKR